MILDEAIRHAEEMAEEDQRVVDTGSVTDGVATYYQRCAKEHRQLAEWLKDYKQLKEQESFNNKNSTVKDITTAFHFGIAMGFAKKYNEIDKIMEEVKKVITPEPKIGRWIDVDWHAEGLSEQAHKCSVCDELYIGYVGEYKYCPHCGVKMQEAKE